jgi:hypothetical protein
MTNLLSNTAVRVALGAVATAAVSAGSFMIGRQVGINQVMAEIPTIVADLLDQQKEAETTNKK